MPDREMQTMVSQSLPNIGDLKQETIGQTYWHLNKLIQGKSSSDFENIEEFISSKLPFSLFDESLRLIVIDLLHLSDYVVKVLLSQNNYQIKRILRCDWFFKNALTPDRYCSEIFPHISVSLRYKLIGKLSKKLTSDKDAEQFFKFIRQNYSKSQAELFLPKCSSSFIWEYFLEAKPTFQYKKSEKILLCIGRRYPQLTVNILSALLNQNVNLQKHCKVLIFLASNHLQIFIPFFEKYFFKLLFLRFGVKLSQKLGLKLKYLIWQRSELVKSSVFNKSAFFVKLSFDDQVKILSAMVVFGKKKLTFLNWIDSTYSMCELLKLIKPTERLPVIEATFKQVYNLNLRNHIKICDPQILELIPLNLRLPYVEAYEKAIADDSENEDKSCGFYDEMNDWKPMDEPKNFVYLYSFEKAFPRFKEILAKAPSIYMRQDVLKCMVQNCAINRDVENLKELVDFVGVRFRNEAPYVLVQFLDDIFWSFPLDTINSETFERIEEILYLCFLNNERHRYGQMMEKCLLHRLRNKSDIKSQVEQIVDWYISDDYVRSEFVHDSRSAFSRQLFFAFYKEFVAKMAVESANENRIESFAIWILKTAMKINESHRREPITASDLSELIPALNKIVRKNGHIFDDFDVSENLEGGHVRVLHPVHVHKLIKFILKRNPGIVTREPRKFVRHLLSNFCLDKNAHLLRYSKKIFSFAGVAAKVKEIAIGEFDECSGSKKKNALTMISHVCDLEEFEKIVETYVPKEEKTIDKNAAVQFLEIQLLVPEVIKNLTPSWKNLNLIFKFFNGDFLPRALPSFRKCCHSTRVDYLTPILVDRLEKMSNEGKISTKKEIIRSLLDVSDFREAVDVCRRCWKMIRHYSIRTILFKRISSAFLEQPTKEIFEILSKFISESDELVIESRPPLESFPRDYFADYVSALWKFSENQTHRVRSEIRDFILSGINLSNVGLLENGFSETLIRENFFNRNRNGKKFASYYLMQDADELNTRMTFILGLIKDSMTEIDSISDFLKTLRTSLFEKSNSSVEILENLFKKWPYQRKSILYDDRLLLGYHLLYHKIFTADSDLATSEEKWREFGRELKKFFCGHDDLDHLAGIMLDSFRLFVGEMESHGRELDLLVTLNELLREHEEVSLAIFVILGLPQDMIKLYKMEDRTFDSVETRQRNLMNRIVNRLDSFQNESVQIYLRRRFGFRNSESYLIV